MPFIAYVSDTHPSYMTCLRNLFSWSNCFRYPNHFYVSYLSYPFPFTASFIHDIFSTCNIISPLDSPQQPHLMPVSFTPFYFFGILLLGHLYLFLCVPLFFDPMVYPSTAMRCWQWIVLARSPLIMNILEHRKLWGSIVTKFQGTFFVDAEGFRTSRKLELVPCLMGLLDNAKNSPHTTGLQISKLQRDNHFWR